MFIRIVTQATYAERHMHKMSRLTSSTFVVDHLVKWLPSIRRSMDHNVPVEGLTKGPDFQFPTPSGRLGHVLEIDFEPIFVNTHFS